MKNKLNQRIKELARGIKESNKCENCKQLNIDFAIDCDEHTKTKAEFRGVFFAQEEILKMIDEFGNILKNNKNPEFKEYNGMLLADLEDLKKQIKGEGK